MNTVYIFLTTGFEEIEALATVDVLRRGGVPVRTVSLTGERTVTGGHGIAVVADALFDDPERTEQNIHAQTADYAHAAALVVPGGTIAYLEHTPLLDVLQRHASAGGVLAAICAAPAVLGRIGVLKGKKATCYPGFEQYLEGAAFTPEKVVVDGNVITGRGPGLTLEFALTLVEKLAGSAKRAEVENGLLWTGGR